MSIRFLSLSEVQLLVSDTQLSLCGELPSEKLSEVDSTVHAEYIAWCRLQRDFKGLSTLSSAQSRLIRNREISKASRDNKKRRMEELVAEVESLKQENAALRRRMKRLERTAEPDADKPFFDWLSRAMADCVVENTAGEIITFLAPERTSIETC